MLNCLSIDKIQKKLACYSKDNRSLLPKLVRQKIPKGIYCPDEFRQPCLYFKGSEGDLFGNNLFYPYISRLFHWHRTINYDCQCQKSNLKEHGSIGHINRLVTYEYDHNKQDTQIHMHSYRGTTPIMVSALISIKKRIPINLCVMQNGWF